jgi:hypothetical protein
MHEHARISSAKEACSTLTHTALQLTLLGATATTHLYASVLTSHNSAAMEFVVAASAAGSPEGPGTGTVSRPQPHTAEYCNSRLMLMLPAAAAAAKPCTVEKQYGGTHQPW